MEPSTVAARQPQKSMCFFGSWVALGGDLVAVPAEAPQAFLVVAFPQHDVLHSGPKQPALSSYPETLTSLAGLSEHLAEDFLLCPQQHDLNSLGISRSLSCLACGQHLDLLMGLSGVSELSPADHEVSVDREPGHHHLQQNKCTWW